MSKETVNHPDHYNQGIEAIDIIESWNLNFSLGNAIKYILRAPYKGSKIEDIQKAIWYLERELQRKESKEEITAESLNCDYLKHCDPYEIDCEGCDYKHIPRDVCGIGY